MLIIKMLIIRIRIMKNLCKQAQLSLQWYRKAMARLFAKLLKNKKKRPFDCVKILF